MDLETKDSDIYGLIGKLCESLLNQLQNDEDNYYLPKVDKTNCLRKFKSKAYEILLKKCSERNYDSYDKEADNDPVSDLLKHAFVLKVGIGSITKGEELEKLIDEVQEEETENSTVYSVLQFLNCLKSFTNENKDVSDIFYYGKQNPLLPETICDSKTIPPFQIYPIESFCLPAYFESSLKHRENDFISYNITKPNAKLHQLSQFTNTMIFNDIDYTEKKKYIQSNERETDLDSLFFLETKDDIKHKEGIVTEPETPLTNKDPLEWLNENENILIHKENSNENLIDIKSYDFEKILQDFPSISENISNSTSSTYKSWETLGSIKVFKEPPFISESNEATLHLNKLLKENIFPTTKVQECVFPIRIISSKQFLENAKLLLRGIESSIFMHNPVNGFELVKGIAVLGISPETLENISYQFVRWGTCYKNLSDLVTPNLQTGKLQVEGLIFEALCKSIRQFLLFYSASILQIKISDNEKEGILNFMLQMQSLGNIILKVTQLCCCDSQGVTNLGKGIGILTHIYNEVTKVTEQNVALCFYSILKDCCEVYFRFLQQWLFEGICIDIYDEFMINIRPQYLRTRSHRFWTRGFNINQKSVPGFLKNLSEPILQCGKAVILLKICDPKNPLCRTSATSQPLVKVCLSVGMLREQVRYYETYLLRGENEQGTIVTLSSAFKEEKEAKKQRAELVIAAQKSTLVRLKKEKKDALQQIKDEKSKLLKQLKEQAEEVALRKEKDKNAEILAEKLICEALKKQEEEAIIAEKKEKENTIKYYTELANEARKRQIRADWRIQRMKFFEERANLILSYNQQFRSVEDTQISKTPNLTSNNQTLDEINDSSENTFETQVSTGMNDEKSTIDGLNIENACKLLNSHEMKLTNDDADEEKNSNSDIVNKEKIFLKTPHNNIEDLSINNENLLENKKADSIIAEETNTKAPRPTDLNIPETNNKINKLDLLNLNLTEKSNEIQRNKMKILQQEYGITSNNNGSQIRNLESMQDQNDKNEESLKILKTDYLTDEQINKNKIMSPTYNFFLDSDIINKKSSLNKTSDTQFSEIKFMEEEYGFTPNNNEFENITSEIKRIKYPEVNINKTRNMQHQINVNYEDVRATNFDFITEAQANKNKIMSHTYNLPFDSQEKAEQNLQNPLTDAQKNRNKNMAHSIEHYNYDINEKSTGQDKNLCVEEQLKQTSKETPMSTATDHFTISTHSSTIPFLSCENTPLSEIINHRSIDYELNESQIQFPKKFQEISLFPNFIKHNSRTEIPSTGSELTSSDIEMIDTTSLKVYLEKSVIIPLRIQSRLVNRSLIKYLIKEHNILSHLYSLRSYFFLLNGEFSKILTQSLFTRLYEVSSPIDLFNSTILTNILKKALINSLSNSYTNSELLSLSTTDVPQHLKTSNPEMLSCLSLNYKIGWPLNIILNDIVMQQYTKVFKFLLMVGRVLWVLQEDFHILKSIRKISYSKNHHKLQLYRHSMMQFMNALNTYLTCSVLHASWSEFEKNLENATTLDEIYDTHVNYIKKILSKCMLNPRGEKMRASLCNIFQVVLKFHNRIRSQNWSCSTSGSSGPNYENLEKMYTSFCEHRAFLIHVAEKLANSGYQPHLMQFLHALNINPLYNISLKKENKT